MNGPNCPLPPPDQSEIETISLAPENPISDYQEAMALAKTAAEKRLDDSMLISWYDRDRDFESPAHTTECPGDCPKNGYIHYGLNHGATLKGDITGRRFAFFFSSVPW